MKITLWSTNCPKCNVLKIKLKAKKIDFELIEDKDKVVEFGNNCGITSAPILQVDDNYYDFTQAVKWINER